MGLLSKALEYRKNYLKNKPKGLLARALAYRELNDLNSFPEAKDVQYSTVSCDLQGLRAIFPRPRFF